MQRAKLSQVQASGYVHLLHLPLHESLLFCRQDVASPPHLYLYRLVLLLAHRIGVEGEEAEDEYQETSCPKTRFPKDYDQSRHSLFPFLCLL